MKHPARCGTLANEAAIFDSAKRGAMRASMQEGEVSEPNRQTAGAKDANRHRGVLLRPPRMAC